MEVEWNHLYSLEVRAYNHVSVFYQYIRAGTLSYCVVIFVLARLLLRDCVLLYKGQFYHYSTTLLFTNWNLASLESAEQCLYQGFPHGFCIDENVMLTKTLNSLGISYPLEIYFSYFKVLEWVFRSFEQVLVLSFLRKEETI